MKIRDLEWWIIGILWVIAFILAMIGFNILYTEAGVQRNFLDLAFQSMKIYGMEFVDDFPSPLPWPLEVSRWLAPSVLTYTVAKTIMYFIRREFKSFFLQFTKGHIIITSLNEKSRFLVTDLLKQGEKVIVLAGIENPKKLDALEKEGAIIVEGDITNYKFLKNISGHKAKYFVFLEGDDEINISHTLSVYRFLTKFAKDRKQTIYTHVADDIKLNELLALNFFENYMAAEPINNNCDIRIISMFERSSRILFNKYPPEGLSSINSDSPAVNVAIFGSGNLAQSMIIRLARLGHYANFKKIKITLFHHEDKIIRKMHQNFPGLMDLIEFENINEQLELFDVEEFNIRQAKQAFNRIYLLCENDNLSSNILKKLTKNTASEPINVLLTLMNPNGILSKWYTTEKIGNIQLAKFNIIEKSFTEEALISEKIDELAKIIHQDYLSKLSEEAKNDGKPSRQEWDLLPIDFKNQNREQADHIQIKIKLAGYKYGAGLKKKNEETNIQIPNKLIESLAKVEHNRWEAHMILSGWVYGKVRDDEKKIHTDLIPYEELSEGTKQYDRNTIMNIPTLLKDYNKEVVKINTSTQASIK